MVKIYKRIPQMNHKRVLRYNCEKGFVVIWINILYTPMNVTPNIMVVYIDTTSIIMENQEANINI